MRETWNHMIGAGFGPDLLPIIPPGAPLAPSSKVLAASLGKIPGRLGADGLWRGLARWADGLASKADLARWSGWGCGIGLQTRRWPAIDVDVEDAELADAVERLVIARLGAAPVRFGRRPRRVLLYRGGGLRKRRLAFRLPGAPEGEKPQAIELLGEGQQFVAWGRHPAGVEYGWTAPPAAHELVEIDAEGADDLWSDLAVLLDAWGAELVQAHGGGVGGGVVTRAAVAQDGLRAPSLDALRDAVAATPNEGRYDEWIAMGAAVRAACGDDEGAGLDIWLEWSTRWTGGAPDLEAAEAKWGSFRPPFAIGWSWLAHKAREHGYDSATVEFDAVDGAAAPGRVGRAGAGRLAEGAGAGAGGDGRVSIRYSPQELVDATDQAEAAVLADRGNGDVLSYGGAFCDVRMGQPATVRQLDGSTYPPMPLVNRYTAAGLRERVMRATLWWTWSGTKKAWRKDKMPADVVDTLLARGGGGAPPLTGIVEAPTLRPDGSLLAVEGYDRGTGLAAVFNGVAFGLEGAGAGGRGRQPTHSDAQRGLRVLREELFAEFPFAGEVDAAVALSAAATLLVRRSLRGGAPGVVLGAHVQGTGKTALASAIAQVVTGRPPPVVPWPAGEDELRKLVLSILLEGHSVCLFDNLPDGFVVRSAVLAQLLTSETYSDRVLGVSKTATLPTSSLWMLTGNNLTVPSDLASRLLVCTLDAGMERPDQRRFGRELGAWVAEHRARLVRALLDVLWGYQLAGRPGLGKAIGSPSRFADWDGVVRSALVWAGSADPGAAFDAVHAADPEREAHVALLDGLAAVFAGEPFAAGDVVSKLDAGFGPDAGGTDCLREALGVMLGRKVVNSQSVGLLLRRYKGRQANGYVLSATLDKGAGAQRWRVQGVPSPGSGDGT